MKVTTGIPLLLKPGIKPKAQRKTSYVCKGGPFNGRTLFLTTSDTLFFQMGKWHGRYSSGYWQTWEDYFAERSK